MPAPLLERLRAFLPTVMVVAMGLGLTMISTWSAWRAEHERLQSYLEERVENHIRALEKGLSQRVHQVEIVRGIFAANENTTELAFRVFLNNMEMQWQAVVAIAWIPWADGGDRFAIQYCEPADVCRRHLVSLAAETLVRQTLRRAAATKRTVVSPLTPLDVHGTKMATLVAAPVFRRDQKQVPGELRGFVLGTIVVADLVELILNERTVPSGLDLYFYQDTPDYGRQLLYHHPSRTRTTARAPLSETAVLSGPHFLHRISLADTSWILVIRPVPEAIAHLQSAEWLVVLLGGLIVTSLLAAYVLANLRHAARIETTVAARTAELKTANTLLQKAKEDAENAVRAKTRFLAAASHDLRQPLQALNLFVNVLSNRKHEAETHEIVEYIRDST